MRSSPARPRSRSRSSAVRRLKLRNSARSRWRATRYSSACRLVSSSSRPDDETRQKISVVEKRLVDEYGYDAHSAREALNYVTTLLAQE